MSFVQSSSPQQRFLDHGSLSQIARIHIANNKNPTNANASEYKTPRARELNDISKTDSGKSLENIKLKSTPRIT
jgi:hypothetical protein